MSTRTAPSITCPDWCTKRAKEHESELAEWEGACLHVGVTYRTRNRRVEVYAWGRPDGTLDHTEPDEPPNVQVFSHGDDELLPKDALVLAGSIQKAAIGRRR